jgi:hypothetical protein
LTDIAIGLYVDNQAVIGYPCEFVSRYWRNFSRCFWFASDEKNATVLDRICPANVKVEVIDQKINTPADLMKAYPLCIDRLRNAGCRYIALQEADLCFTDRGVKFIEDNIDAMPRMKIPAMQNKLWHETWNNPVGCVVLPADGFYSCGPSSDWEVKLDAKDAGPEAWRVHSDTPGNRLMLDLGYMTPDAFHRKMIGHQRLWPNPIRAEIAIAFARSRADGIRAMMPLVRQEVSGKQEPVACGGQYKQIIDDLGAMDDYREVCELMA